MSETTPTGTRARFFSGQELFLLVALFIGHTLMHCFQQGWYVLLPQIKTTFGLNAVQYGAIESTKSISAGVATLPAAVIGDLLRKRWSLVICMALAGLGLAYLVLSVAPNYGVVLVGAGLVGIGAAAWHPPALSVLSSRLAKRRGLALSVHGMGGNLGNAVGPLGLGVLVGVIGWQPASMVLAFPVIFGATVLWLALRDVPGREGRGVEASQYVTALRELVKNRVLVGLMISTGIRQMGTTTIFAFFPVYCQEDLGFSSAKLGLFVSLLMASGVASQPFLGILSDRFGRKAVLVPSLFVLGALEILLLWAGAGAGLVLVVFCIGLFIYSVGAVIQAAAMDSTAERTGAMTIGFLFVGSFVFAAPSPTIAGALASAYGTLSVFLYSGALVLLSSVIIMFLPIRRAVRPHGE